MIYLTNKFGNFGFCLEPSTATICSRCDKYQNLMSWHNKPILEQFTVYISDVI